MESDSWPNKGFNTTKSLIECVDEFVLCNLWLSFVEQYSRRELTKEIDRLPTVSGIVSELILGRLHPPGKLHHPEQEIYLAEFFKDDLMRKSLFWTMDYDCPTPLKHSPTYMTPSRSKASVRSPVKFEIEGDTNLQHPRREATWR